MNQGDISFFPQGQRLGSVQLLKMISCSGTKMYCQLLSRLPVLGMQTSKPNFNSPDVYGGYRLEVTKKYWL